MSDNLLDLHISQRRLKDNLLCIQAEGEMDINTAPLLRKAIDTALDDGHTCLAVDFSDVRYIDSTGLGVLVAAHKRLGEGSTSLVVICSNKHTLKLFDITGLSSLFTVFSSEAEFNQHFSLPRPPSGADGAPALNRTAGAP